MSSNDVWILGITMTKFGKRPETRCGRASELKPHGRPSPTPRCPMRTSASSRPATCVGGGALGQQLQKQIGQTGIPVYNVANACATGATALRTAIMAIKAGEADFGLAVGAEKLYGVGLLGGGGGAQAERSPGSRRDGRARSWRLDGRRQHRQHARHFAQIGMEYGHRYGEVSFDLFARISEKNHAHSTLNPLAAYNKADDEGQIMGDLMIAYPNTRPMCSANCDGAAAAVVVSDAKLKTLSKTQHRRAVKILRRS